MNFTPETWALSLEAVASAIVAILVMGWIARAAYSQIMAKLESLSNDIEEMKLRNSKADHETEVVKAEQSAQKTTIAVMDERLRNQTHALERIESTLIKVADRLENRGAL